MREGAVVRGRHFIARGMVDPGNEGSKRWIATFSIPRATGGAVVRNRLRRRLRGVVAEMSGQLPEGMKLVVSYLPKEAGASFQELASELRELLVNLGRQLRVGVGR